MPKIGEKNAPEPCYTHSVDRRGDRGRSRREIIPDADITPFPCPRCRAISAGAFVEAEMKHKVTDPFYRSKRWERLRAAALRRDGYMCQESKRFGKRAEATTVHHVFPRNEFPEYQWEPWNLVSLAGDVHDQMHDRTSGALTQRGAELLRRVARKNGVEVPRRYRG